MDITWYGQACFRLRDTGVAVITDPYDKSIGLKLPRQAADIVTISHQHPGHSSLEAIKNEPFIISGPGEYEVKGVFVTGVSMWHDNKGGKERGRNTIYLYEIGGVTICHLGDLGHIPTQTQVEEMGPVGVLLLPVGGKYTIDAKQATEVVSLIEPSIVIPMHYALPGLNMPLAGVETFLKEMGVSDTETLDSIRLTNTQLPEQTKVVLLQSRAG